MAERFRNLDPAHAPHGFADVFRWSVLDRLTARRKVAPPGPPAPRVAPNLDAIGDLSVPRATWIGHSSFLASLAGASVLIDPVFSRKIGLLVPRHGEPGLEPADLPPLTALLVTHNHYDHLDAPSIEVLPRTLPVVAPLGLGAWFRRRGFTSVRELRWWERVSAGPIEVTFVPARHWSRRRPTDTNRSLWGGFVVSGGGRTLYHAGDTGWFDGFREIAARVPAIDLALLPIGAYEPAWFMEPHHMNPEQAIEAHRILGARAMAPMHWGAFQLTDEPLREPVERLRRAWTERTPDGKLHVLAVGESVAI